MSEPDYQLFAIDTSYGRLNVFEDIDNKDVIYVEVASRGRERVQISRSGLVAIGKSLAK